MTRDIVGYLASTMVFLTFLTKDMRHLRVLAIISNVAFLTYGYLDWLPPVFCLHLILLPLNTFRLHEMLRQGGNRLADRWPTQRQPILVESSKRITGFQIG